VFTGSSFFDVVQEVQDAPAKRTCLSDPSAAPPDTGLNTMENAARCRGEAPELGSIGSRAPVVTGPTARGPVL
jgi:hypothetical protein